MHFRADPPDLSALDDLATAARLTRSDALREAVLLWNTERGTPGWRRTAKASAAELLDQLNAWQAHWTAITLTAPGTWPPPDWDGQPHNLPPPPPPAAERTPADHHSSEAGLPPRSDTAPRDY